MIISYKGRYGLWRLINIIILGLLISGAMFTYYFIYENIYSTIANANAIVALRSNMSIYDLDLPAYEKARAIISRKKQLEEFPPNVRNIFYYGATTSVYANTSTRP